MARYTADFIIDFKGEEIGKILLEILAESSLKLIHQQGDFLIFREEMREVYLSHLVTLEIKIQPKIDDHFKLSLLTYNEEIPVYDNNHCRQVIEDLVTLILNESQWRVIEWIII